MRGHGPVSPHVSGRVPPVQPGGPAASSPAAMIFGSVSGRTS
ncbi:unnamed protein product [[Actinomadura] parvosata subsp. kistnae]|nr:unnamed protein product [Actinomadura parvosata subsp. kistnae]